MVTVSPLGISTISPFIHTGAFAAIVNLSKMVDVEPLGKEILTEFEYEFVPKRQTVSVCAFNLTVSKSGYRGLDRFDLE